MYKLFFIARNNMKKQKGDMITFFVLTFFAAFLIFDAASAILGVGKVLDDRFAETNSPHVIMITGASEEEKACISRACAENAHITETEITPALFTESWRYRNAKETEWDEYEFLVEYAEGGKTMMVHDPEDTALTGNEITLPLYLQGRFAVGDTMQIGIGNDVYDLRVAGYMEDPYFCSSMNITVYYVYMTREQIGAMLADHPELEEKMSVIAKGMMDRKEEGAVRTEDVEKEITDRYKELIAPYVDGHPDRHYLSYLSTSWENMRGGSTFLPMIIMGIVMLFAVIILAVAVIIIVFSIRNFIRRSMKDTGALEASGYTVRELRGALTVQVVLAALAGSIAGVLLGIATFGIFGNVVSGILGISWNQPVNFPAAAATVLGLTGVMALTAVWISRAFRKFTVLDALRGGISTHNYRKNHFSLEKTKLPVPAALSMKDALGNPGRNTVLAMIAAILTITMLMGFGMYENFGKNASRMMEILGFEAGDISVTGGRELGDELRRLEGAGNVLGLYGFEPTFSFGGTEKTAYVYALDDMANTTNLVVIEGREAKHPDEIMMTDALSKDLGLKAGDVVTAKFGSHSAEYLVTGTYQRMDRMGRTAYLTFEGADRILRNNTVYYYITGKDGAGYDELKRETDALAAEKGTEFQTSDIWKTTESTIGTMADAMKGLCAGIAVVTILVVIFVEALIIRSKIIREWRGMGISKAMGMTSGGLIVQIMLSNIPAIVTGILAGLLLAPAAGSRVSKVILSMFGIIKLSFPIPAGYMAFTAAAILAVALGTAGLIGLKVRKINPVEMITEE